MKNFLHLEGSPVLISLVQRYAMDTAATIGETAALRSGPLIEPSPLITEALRQNKPAVPLANGVSAASVRDLADHFLPAKENDKPSVEADKDVAEPIGSEEYRQFVKDCALRNRKRARIAQEIASGSRKKGRNYAAQAYVLEILKKDRNGLRVGLTSGDLADIADEVQFTVGEISEACSQLFELREVDRSEDRIEGRRSYAYMRPEDFSLGGYEVGMEDESSSWTLVTV